MVRELNAANTMSTCLIVLIRIAAACVAFIGVAMALGVLQHLSTRGISGWYEAAINGLLSFIFLRAGIRGLIWLSPESARGIAGFLFLVIWIACLRFLRAESELINSAGLVCLTVIVWIAYRFTAEWMCRVIFGPRTTEIAPDSAKSRI
jgi:hypothetical protein